MRSIPKTRWEDAFSVIEPHINAASVHMWRFDEDFPIDVRFLIMRREAEIRMNVHDYFEILYLHSGEVVYQVADRLFPMKPGDLFVMSGALPHRMVQYGQSHVRTVALYFLPELIRAHDPTGDDVEYLMPFLVQDAGFPHIVRAKTGIPAEIFTLMRRTHAELPADTQRGKLSVRTYLKMMLVLLVNHYNRFHGSERVFHRRQGKLERLAPVFDFIEAHFREDITIKAAAALINMSDSHFMRFFKQVTGQPFVAHLNQFRVAKAQKLLATTDLSIAEISLEVGFCNQSYFGLVFRRLAHMTPRDYKVQVEKQSSNDETRTERNVPK